MIILEFFKTYYYYYAHMYFYFYIKHNDRSPGMYRSLALISNRGATGPS